MKEYSKSTITIIDILQEQAISPGERPLHTRGMPERIVQATERTVDEVRRNMKKFVNGVQTILAEGATLAGQYEIDTVEVNAQVTGEGKIGFAGSGIGLAGSTGLKIIFKRHKKR